MNEGIENLPAVLSQFRQNFSKGICVTKLILLYTQWALPTGSFTQ